MKTLSLLPALILACASLVTDGASATSINPAFEFDTPSFSYTDGNDWNLGIDFLVDQTLSVDALAYYDDGPSVSSHMVALFAMDGSKLAETIVNPSDTLSGNFRYSSIAPVTLIAGGRYRIVGNSSGDNLTFAVSNFSVNPLLSYLGYSYSAAQGLTADFDGDAETGNDIEAAAWGASFSVSPRSVNLPEPASIALLLAGLVLLGLHTRRPI